LIAGDFAWVASHFDWVFGYFDWTVSDFVSIAIDIDFNLAYSEIGRLIAILVD
jgi:hypothetical protein